MTLPLKVPLCKYPTGTDSHQNCHSYSFLRSARKVIFCLIVEGLEKQFQLLCKTTLITLLADSAGNISLTFKTVNSEMFDLLMKLFETKDGYVIYSTEPAYS